MAELPKNVAAKLAALQQRIYRVDDVATMQDCRKKIDTLVSCLRTERKLRDAADTQPEELAAAINATTIALNDVG